MDNELSQLDALIESDVLDALGKEPTETTFENAGLEDEILIEDLEDETNENDDTHIVEENDTDGEIQEDNAITEVQEDISLLEEPLIEDIIPDIPSQGEQDISTASLSKLLGELLNNKTIEITIKIKE